MICRACAGLEYITEFQPRQRRKEPVYTCDLCGARMDPRQVINHVMGVRHRRRFLVSSVATNACVQVSVCLSVCLSVCFGTKDSCAAVFDVFLRACQWLLGRCAFVLYCVRRCVCTSAFLRTWSSIRDKVPPSSGIHNECVSLAEFLRSVRAGLSLLSVQKYNYPAKHAEYCAATDRRPAAAANHMAEVAARGVAAREGRGAVRLRVELSEAEAARRVGGENSRPGVALGRGGAGRDTVRLWDQSPGGLAR